LADWKSGRSNRLVRCGKPPRRAVVTAIVACVLMQRAAWKHQRVFRSRARRTARPAPSFLSPMRV